MASSGGGGSSESDNGEEENKQPCYYAAERKTLKKMYRDLYGLKHGQFLHKFVTNRIFSEDDADEISGIGRRPKQQMEKFIQLLQEKCQDKGDENPFDLFVKLLRKNHRYELADRLERERERQAEILERAAVESGQCSSSSPSLRLWYLHKSFTQPSPTCWQHWLP